jgi:hypothetical protein
MAEYEGADDFIAVSAFRYALGRQTYAVTRVVKWLERNKAAMSDHTRELIVREIHEAANAGRIGGDMDRREWLQFATEMLRVAA